MFNHSRIVWPLTIRTAMPAAPRRSDWPRRGRSHPAAWFCWILVLGLAGRSSRGEVPPYIWQPVSVPGTNGTVLAAAEFDDGTGPALYVGGSFTSAGTTPASHVAKWDGQQWSALGAGLNGQVNAMAVLAPASGPASLYAGGSFPGGIARWDGAQWVPIGIVGLGGTPVTVSALGVFDDDGPGPNPPYLVIVGTFTAAEGTLAQNVAKWDGVSLSPGPRYNGQILSLQAFAGNGAGPAILFAGTAAGLVKLSGTSWSDYAWVSANLTTSMVRSLCVYAPGGTACPSLVCGGDFLKKPAPGAPGNRIVGFDGASFLPIGSGVGMDALVYSVATFGDTSPLLVAGGSFNTVDGVSMPRIACWDGTSWSGILGGAGGGNVRTVAAVHLQGESQLVVGGSFTSAGGGPVSYIWLLRQLFLPRITQQPADQAVRAGGTATFTVAASGSGTLSYRWLRSGEEFSTDSHCSDVTSPTLTFSNVDSSLAGPYRCRVTSSIGDATSDEAALTVAATVAGDINADGTIDSLDLLCMADSWGKSLGNGGYDARCDLDSDNGVDIIDLLILADNWGK